LESFTSASPTALAVAFSSLLGMTVPVQEVRMGPKRADQA
jgi:hypothetical protein